MIPGYTIQQPANVFLIESIDQMAGRLRHRTCISLLKTREECGDHVFAPRSRKIGA